MKVVLDANVVIAGCGWRGQPYACLLAMARRRVFAFATAGTLEETRETAHRVMAERPVHRGALPVLNWYLTAVALVEPAPLGKRRSRDPKDDPYLACALSAGAVAVVTFDRDLLDLEKPFGIAMWEPRQLLDALRA